MCDQPGDETHGSVFPVRRYAMVFRECLPPVVPETVVLVEQLSPNWLGTKRRVLGVGACR
jgi:hypothetical protein